MWFGTKGNKKTEDLPETLLVERPNFDITVEIFSRYSNGLKQHLLVALIRHTPKEVLQKVRHAFNKYSV